MERYLLSSLLLTSVASCGETAEPVESETALLQSSDSNELRRARGAYTFTKVAAVGELAPGGSRYDAYFFPHGLSDDGDVFFAAGLSSSQQSFFRMQRGKAAERLGVSGQPAPGGGTYGEGWAGFGSSINQRGDVVFQYLVDATFKDSFPLGLHGGVYRADADGTVRGLMRPLHTPAPNGKPFRGLHMYAAINNRRDIAFAGIIETSHGIKVPPEPDLGLGMGVFLADSRGSISSIVSPGDPAPNKGVFDFAENPSLNDRGDVAFGAHVAGEDCVSLGLKQAERIFCGESVYLYRKASGRIVSIAHQGEPAPGGGTYRLAFGPALNNHGDLVFIGDLTPPPGFFQKNAVFLWSRGSTIAIARPGDPMPGGGHMLSASGFVQGYSLNDRRQVFFFATLDTDEDGDGLDDTGVFVWQDGKTRMVLRSGTHIPGVGTASQLADGCGYGSAVSNQHGEVLTSLATTAGNRYLLRATPR